MRGSPIRLVGVISLLGALGACTVPSELTQVVVGVNAEPSVAARLVALRVRLYAADATDEAAPAREQLIPLRPSSASAGTLLPLSFGILRMHADTFLLSIEGCGDGERCSDSLVRQKVFVRFQPHQTIQLSIVLADKCATPAATCGGLSQTCATGAGASARDLCGPVPTADTTLVQPGHETLPKVPVADVPIEVPDAGADGSLDAGNDAGEASLLEPTRDSGADPTAPATCPSDNTCLADVYPCLADDGMGYVCRGQFADWPMPDNSRDGGVSQSYDIESVPGVARDRVTGLSWQRQTPNSYAGCTGRQNSPGDLCDFPEAVAYCDGLTLAGLRWRLPTKIELESLLDFRPELETLDTSVFFYTSSRTMYWSASPPPRPDFGDKRYTVSFMQHNSSWSDTNIPLAVRCVHSDDVAPHAVPSRYVPRPVEGSIGDTRTGLLWYPTLLCEDDLTYERAEAFCAGLPQRLRVPTTKELLTLVDPTRVPVVDPVFADTPKSGYLWTSSIGTEVQQGRFLMLPGIGHTLREFEVSAQLANPDLADIPHPFCVRCVQ